MAPGTSRAQRRREPCHSWLSDCESHMHEQQRANSRIPRHLQGLQHCEAAEQGAMDKAPDDQHHHHQHTHHDHHPHQSMPARQKLSSADPSMACQSAASMPIGQVPAEAIPSPADGTTLSEFSPSGPSVPGLAAEAASQTVLAASQPPGMHAASSTGDIARPHVPNMHESMMRPDVPSAETAALAPNGWPEMQDAPKATAKELSSGSPCTNPGQCMSMSHDQAQPDAGGADLSAQEKLMSHDGDMPSEHWVEDHGTSPMGTHKPSPSTSHSPAVHQRPLQAQDGASGAAAIEKPNVPGSSAGHAHEGRVECSGHDGPQVDGSHAGKQQEQGSSHNKETKKTPECTTSSRKRKQAVHNKSRSRIPAMVKPLASTGRKRARSPQQSTSSPHARHASRRRSWTGPRSVSPAIRRTPVSSSRHVKKQKASASGRREQDRREAGSDSSQSSWSRQVYGPRHKKVRAGSLAFLRTAVLQMDGDDQRKHQMGSLQQQQPTVS